MATNKHSGERGRDGLREWEWWYESMGMMVLENGNDSMRVWEIQFEKMGMTV